MTTVQFSLDHKDTAEWGRLSDSQLETSGCLTACKIRRGSKFCRVFC